MSRAPPGSTAEPLAGIRAAAARGLDAEQAISLASEGVAYAMFGEGERGAVRVGNAADLTIYDRDPLQKDARLVEALVDGR